MKNLFLGTDATVKEALKTLDHFASKVLLVVDNSNKLLGTLTDGDIRRHLLKGGSLQDPIQGIYNTQPKYAEDADPETLRKILLKFKIDLVPVLDSAGRVTDAYSWEDVFETPKHKQSTVLQDVPTVIMAGGKGTRMQPFTSVLPKPLIPIGDKTILELLMDNFAEYGVRDFFFTVNYRGEMIKAYFDSIEKKYSIHYVWEKEFAGTAGSLSLIESMDRTFLVSNCDIIVKANYEDIYNFHKENRAALTVVSSIQHHTVPYGVIDYSDGGVVTAIREKPEFSFPINTGVYLLEPEVLAYIPANQVFHMTHLMEALIDDGKKVLTYLVNEKDYIDIGQWEEYRKALTIIGT
jgi:dTDP-glucose pyrophosphorylase